MDIEPLPNQNLYSRQTRLKILWETTKPNLKVNCLLCKFPFKVKYNLLKKQYSLQNNWGYWTSKEENQNDYLCNTCLLKLLGDGKLSKWITEASKQAVFRTYLYRGQFGKRNWK